MVLSLTLHEMEAFQLKIDILYNLMPTGQSCREQNNIICVHYFLEVYNSVINIMLQLEL